VLRKLRTKFVCINMAIVTLMLCVIFFLLFNSTKANLEQQSIQMMKAIAANTYIVDKPGSVLPDNIRLPYFTLYIDPFGRLIAADGGYFDLTDWNTLKTLSQLVLDSNKKTATLPEYSLRYLRVDSPFGQTIVFADITSEIETVNALTRNSLIIGLISFVAFLCISIVLAKWAVRPVDRAWKQQKQFTADASHELKTPLTVITTNAELLQTDDYDETERKEFLTSITHMAEQMRGLVEQLLEMARIDNDMAQNKFTSVDLSELALDAVMPFEPLFYERGLTLDIEVQEGIRIQGHKDQLTNLIDIYLDNARKYAHTGTGVKLKLKKAYPNVCVLSVESRGDPISAEDLKHIFKRFYRADKARAMNQSYGLGLAIAESIAENHKGKVWATSTNGINTFYAQIPIKAGIPHRK